ncbi:HAD family hydrolase [Kiloniella laminariae]|uniref:HAD family hydrolase n=1 Tax=Kiloniella laminariae TaxID=454162 RepID=UPI00036482E8|nr:HAD-IA family hydrolase [Kiloniella laminariae]
MTHILPKAMIFDWDNTLIDSWVIIHHALSVTFQEMGMTPWSLDEAKDRVRASARDSFPAIFGKDTEVATRIFYNTYEASHLDVLTPLSGARELLDLARVKGIYLAVVSNKQGRILRKEAEHLGWSSLFGQLIGATDAPKDKPDPYVVELALKESGLSAGKDVWFVGDTDIDLICAHNAQCYPVLVRPEPPAVGEFLGHAPSQYVSSCDELKELLL